MRVLALYIVLLSCRAGCHAGCVYFDKCNISTASSIQGMGENVSESDARGRPYNLILICGSCYNNQKENDSAFDASRRLRINIRYL